MRLKFHETTADAPEALTGPEAGFGRDVVQDVVAKAARVTGAVADAVVEIDADEHRRRAACGLGAVELLGLLDALMCLPYGAAIPVRDVGKVALWHLHQAPEGCVQWGGGESGCNALVRRLLVPVASVPLVVVRAAGWRTGLRRAAQFEPFARRVVVLRRAGRGLGEYAWEADAAGTGLWVARPGSDQVDEIVAPARFTPRYFRPARWRFAERAYTAWLSANRP